MASTGGARYPGGNTGGSRAGNTAQGTGSTRPRRNRPNRNGSGRGGQHHGNRGNHGGGNNQSGTPTGGGPLTPQNYGQALGYNAALKLAKMIGGLQYDPQIGQLKGLAANVPSYFNQYRQALTNAQTQTNQFAQPILTTAQQAVQGTGQTLGLAGPAAADDQLAAASRAQQAQAMASALQGVQGATNTYFNQTGANSYGAQASAAQQLGQQIAGLKGQRSSAIAQNLQDIRTGDREYNLEVKTLLGNQAADRAKAKNDAAQIKAGNRKAANDFLAKNGVSQKTWRNMTPKERVAWKREWTRSQQSASDKLDTARLKYFRQHGYFPPTGPGGGVAGGKDQYGNTPRQQRSANSAWTKARSLAGLLVKPSKKNPEPITKWREAFQLLANAPGMTSVDSDVLKVAAMRATHTHIPSSLIESLRKQGVDVAQIRNPRNPGHAPRHRGSDTGQTQQQGRAQ